MFIEIHKLLYFDGERDLERSLDLFAGLSIMHQTLSKPGSFVVLGSSPPTIPAPITQWTPLERYGSYAEVGKLTDGCVDLLLLRERVLERLLDLRGLLDLFEHIYIIYIFSKY